MWTEEYERAPRRFLLRWLGWFGVGNVLALILVSLRNLAVTDAPQGALPWLYRLLMFAGHGAFLAFVPLFVVLLLTLAWPRRGLVMTLATAMGAALVFATLIDTIIFQQYRFHLNAEIWNLLFGGAARFLIFALFEGELLSLSGYLLDTAALALIGIFAFKLTQARKMVSQYPWLYERAGLFRWRAFRAGGSDEVRDSGETTRTGS